MMRSRILKAAFIVLACAALTVAALDFAAPAKPDGKAIFQQKCAMCHGMDGKGFAAIHTPDFTNAKWQAAHADTKLLDVIKNGKKGTAMMAFDGKLSEAEMRAVLSYIRSLGPSKSAKSKSKKK